MYKSNYLFQFEKEINKNEEKELNLNILKFCVKFGLKVDDSSTVISCHPNVMVCFAINKFPSLFLLIKSKVLLFEKH